MMLKLISDVKNERVDAWIVTKTSEVSRTFVKKISEDGKLRINDKVVKCSEKLKIGDIVELELPKPKEMNISAQEIPFEVLYEDDDIIVVNKPKGMVVHPAAGNHDGTLVNALLARYGENLSNINGVIRPGIVHRIDKDTSGVLVIARNNKAHQKLSALFKAHDINRVYIALVHGEVMTQKGTIDGPIGRHPIDRKKMAINIKNGRRAVTHFKVIERFEKATLLEVTLETGRTHQIRVHLAYIGHPLYGDTVYGRKKSLMKAEGQYLHAKKLGFVHPSTGKYNEYCSEIPKYFQDYLDILKDSSESR